MYMHDRFLRAMAILLFLALIPLTTCGKDSPTKPQAPEPTPPPPPPPAPVATRVEISPSSANLTSVGQTVQLSARVFDQNNAQMSSAVVTWSSSDLGIATVNNQGLVTSVTNGMATITARSGNASAGISVTVMQSVGRIRIEPSSVTLTGTGETVQLAATIYDQRSQQVTNAVVTWSSSDTGVATVSGQGLVTAVANGTATITAQSGNASASVSVTVDSSDRDVLVSLYHATNGPNWVRSDNWLSDKPLGTWYGVETDASGRVDYLDLEGNGLDGSLPEELGNLEKLTVLYLHTNQLTGSIPRNIGDLTQLETLVLAYNRLSGEIPPEIGNLENLTYLRLDRNQLLTGPIPPELGNLGKLTFLWIDGNQLTGNIPPELGNLTQLTRLDLGVNQLTGTIPIELGNLTKLETFNVVNNRLTGIVPPELGNLVNLISLTLSDNRLVGPIPQSFLALNKLESIGCQRTGGLCLPATDAFREWARQVEARGNVDFPVDIPYCDEIDRRGLAALYEATNGENWAYSDGWLDEDKSLDEWFGVQTDSIGRVFSIDLSSNGLSGSVPEPLGLIANMKNLRIGSNALSGRLPLSLSALPLEEFDYTGTSLCVADDPDFQDWLDGISQHNGTGILCAPLTEREILSSLYWSMGGPSWANNERWLSDSPLSTWYGVETDNTGRVVALRLRYNNLFGELPAETGQLTALRILYLGSNRLLGSIPRELGDLEQLERLSLGANQFSGEIPAELGRLAQLQHLDLHYLRSLTGPIPANLGDLSNLIYLGLSQSQVTGHIPTQLGALTKLENLDLQDNELTGPIPPELGKLTNLVSMNLAGNQVSGSIPAELGNLSNLTLIDLSRSQLTGSVPAELGALDELEHMVLNENELTGSIPPGLGELANLVSLNLADNQVSGLIPTELGDLANLTDLNLGDNQLTGAIPADLGRIGGLESLDLRSNKLSGPVPPEFGNLTQMKSLVLADNPELGGRLPAEITALERLELFMAGGTGLCRPANARFDVWFRTIADRRLLVCEGGASVYLTQSVQSWDDPVPLLEGEPALLRVFVTGPQEDNAVMPDVRATFYLNGVERHSVHIPSSYQAIPPMIDEGDLDLSVNADIPEWLIAPGLEMVIDVDPDGAIDPALGLTMRIPDSGRFPIDVRTPPPFRLTLVPILFESNQDRSIVETVEAMAADPHGHELLRDVHALLPISEFDLDAHDPVISTSRTPGRMLNQIEALRLMEGREGYWMGMIPKWEPGGVISHVSGIAELGGYLSVSVPDAGIIAHELGHNLGLDHAPCGGIGPGSDDPWFPHPGGSIGVWGYDAEENVLVPPGTPDIMSYCRDPHWISDFFFNKALNYRLTNEDGAVMAAAQARTLLLWGGRDEDGVPYLDPAFVVDAVPSTPLEGGDYTIEGAAADDEVLFSYSFDMPVNPDARGEESSFVFTLPVQRSWAGNLESITLSGPGGTAVLDETTNRPMAILRDSATGQVHAFLSDLPTGGSDGSVAARATVVDSGLETLFSRGIPELK